MTLRDDEVSPRDKSLNHPVARIHPVSTSPQEHAVGV